MVQLDLAREGLARGDRVAVLAPNSVEWVCFDQAAQGLGLVVVPLYTTDSPGNIAYILGDSGARLALIGSAAQWQGLAPLRGEFPALARILCLDENGPRHAAAGIAWGAVSQWLPADWRGGRSLGRSST